MNKALKTEEDRARAAENLREEMEALGATIRDLVLRLPPIQLLGYLLAQFHTAMLLNPSGTEDDPRPNKEAIKTFQFVLEYVHAVWSSHAPLADESEKLDEADAGALMDALARLEDRTMWYCLASSETATEFHAKSTWTLLRGHRYQVLEGEFFRFVLTTHDQALRQAYGVGSDEIASGIQNISDALRTGFSSAANQLVEAMDDVERMVQESGEPMDAVLGRLRDTDSSFTAAMSGIFQDMFLGGVCNLSRHSRLPRELLEDLSYEPGQNEEFFGPGEFSGTPMRTLPARIRPGIRLGGDYYATDGQFVRDSAYRAIQWGLWKRLPYRDEWLKRQGEIVEQAFPTIFAEQLRGARSFESIFYRDPDSGDWVETDRLIVLADVLFVIEAKAGAMPVQSPAMNFASHERVIKSLIVDAYRQCKRFVDYLASAEAVSLFQLVDGEHVEVGSIRRDQFRLILPIGLTVEAFTPFSAMAKELPSVEPILGRHPFISMSVDDLFVLKRFLPTTGELIHYFEVRQQVAGLKGALLFDETDHLGAYIAKNRFDMDIRSQLEEADQVTWDGFSDKVDRHFEGAEWEQAVPPSQDFPPMLASILEVLDCYRPMGWLRFDGLLRDLGEYGRQNVSRYFGELVPTLAKFPRRRIQIGNNPALQFWLYRKGSAPSADTVRFEAQVGCLTVGAAAMNTMLVEYGGPGKISAIECHSVAAPSLLQANYGALVEEAERQKSRIVELG